jgi:hypothetical protein
MAETPPTLAERARLVARGIHDMAPEPPYCQGILHVVQTAWPDNGPAVRSIDQLFRDDEWAADSLYADAERLLKFRDQAGDDAAGKAELLEIFEADLNPPRPI